MTLHCSINQRSLICVAVSCTWTTRTLLIPAYFKIVQSWSLVTYSWPLTCWAHSHITRAYTKPSLLSPGLASLSSVLCIPCLYPCRALLVSTLHFLINLPEMHGVFSDHSLQTPPSTHIPGRHLITQGLDFNDFVLLLFIKAILALGSECPKGSVGV